MAFTQAQVDAVEAIIASIAANPNKTVEINGRRYTRYDLTELLKVRDAMQSDVTAEDLGGAVDIIFKEVS
jgi:hypothetical protein